MTLELDATLNDMMKLHKYGAVHVMPVPVACHVLQYRKFMYSFSYKSKLTSLYDTSPHNITFSKTRVSSKIIQLHGRCWDELGLSKFKLRNKP